MTRFVRGAGFVTVVIGVLFHIALYAAGESSPVGFVGATVMIVYGVAVILVTLFAGWATATALFVPTDPLGLARMLLGKDNESMRRLGERMLARHRDHARAMRIYDI